MCRSKADGGRRCTGGNGRSSGGQPASPSAGPWPQMTRTTSEGTETLPVDPSVRRCAEDQGAWGGAPEGWTS